MVWGGMKIIFLFNFQFRMNWKATSIVLLVLSLAVISSCESDIEENDFDDGVTVEDESIIVSI